jgi:hypothetical protein
VRSCPIEDKQVISGMIAVGRIENESNIRSAVLPHR